VLALTPSERERTRYHLGYLNTGIAGSIQFGLPRPVQTLFILEDAMSIMTDDSAVGRVRQHLKILDDIECRMVSAQSRLAAQQLGEITLRDNEPDLLENEYYRWAGRLADQLGVPFYAYSNRFKGRGPTSGSIPVRRG
jgi:hypothetical protein